MEQQSKYKKLAQRVAGLEKDNRNLRANLEKLKYSEELHRITLENISDTVIITDDDGNIVYACPNTYFIFGLSQDKVCKIGSVHELIGGTVCDVSDLREKEEIANIEWSITDQSGREHFLLINIRLVDIKGGSVLYVMRDITDYRLAKNALNKSERRYQALFNDSPVPLWEEDFTELRDYLEALKNEGIKDFRAFFDNDPSQLRICAQKIRITDVNQATLDLHQAKCKEDMYGNLERIFTDKSLEVFKEEVLAIINGQLEYEAEGEVQTLAGEPRMVSIYLKIDNSKPDETKALVATVDITEREQLKAQLLQAQRLETVGRLAGGVAHDYNNMLNVISGYSEMAIEKVSPEDPLREDLDEIFTAAKRATEVTRQLLAFARKQIISPKVIDLNQGVENMLRLLHRLIGEDIELVWSPGQSLWPVKIDPSQIDQIMANLCVNARDAIDDVGKVTIETCNVVFDQAYCSDHPGSTPGEYVMLAISDDGCGIEQENLGNVFEPFFTTKGVGEGTGLGLSTVYGIVKQNNGFIQVFSQLGKGTVVKIYLARSTETIDEDSKEDPIDIPSGRGEIVLLVEDEPSMLSLAKQMLEGLGYAILKADKPGRAKELFEACKDKIDLLVTDVILPDMNGAELADQLRSINPDLKCVFMSGYTENMIARHGVLKEGIHFIQKPFTVVDFAFLLRKVLDTPSRN